MLALLLSVCSGSGASSALLFCRRGVVEMPRSVALAVAGKRELASNCRNACMRHFAYGMRGLRHSIVVDVE